MPSSPSPRLSASQMATLAELGEERTAAVGDALYRIGDQRYPFIAIIEGEVAILDDAGNEIARHGPSGFLGELNLLSGQTVFVTAVVTQPVRYIAVDRDVLRPLLFDDGSLSDLLLSTFIARRELLQGVQGLGLEVFGPRSSEATMRMLEFARNNRLPFTWRDPGRAEDPAAPELVEELDASSLPLVRLPGGTELRGPTTGQMSRALGIGRVLEPREEVDLLVVGAGPGGLGAAVYGASEGLDTLVIDSTARAVLLATGAQYRRLPVEGLSNYEGVSVFYAAGPPEAQLCGASRVGVVGGGNSAGQAAVWLARGGALVTLLHRRADLRETMSDYLIRELDRYGVAVRDRSEIAELHGDDGRLEAVTLTNGERAPFSFLFLFLGALPCTEWLGDVVPPDGKGFIPYRAP